MHLNIVFVSLTLHMWYAITQKRISEGRSKELIDTPHIIIYVSGVMLLFLGIDSTKKQEHYKVSDEKSAQVWCDLN